MRAHPDKAAAKRASGRAYTVDDVKQAYAELQDEEGRKAYDAWLAIQYTSAPGTGVGANPNDEDFLLGLEVLDLSDFENINAPPSSSEEDSDEEAEREAVVGPNGHIARDHAAEMENRWRRACRCGGYFEIEEGELDHAAQEGKSEVVVGCGMCSLWVRVAFGVEEVGGEDGEE